MLKFDWNALFTIVNLVIFYLLMKKFLFGRIKKVMDARKELIQKQFDDAQAAEDAAKAMQSDYEEKIAGADVEREQIISDAKDSAKAEYDKILERAAADAQQMKEDARKQIALDNENARKAAKEEMATLVMQAAEKVVGESVTAQTDSDIFDEFLNEGSDK